ncbi:GNAT family N-acetyltransferase [Nocardioidaceae bacterium]|nr:GNAT family N-acetyltransferase [Nocardioidaceae bacterium]
MSARLRPLRDADVDRVLALNEEHVAVLSPLDRARLTQLRGWAQRFDVVVLEEPDEDEQVVGFVVVVGPGSAYDSAKYRWFDAAYDEFLYLDRIVLDARVHRRGLGTIVYDEVEGDAVSHGRLCLEVDTDPPNAASLAFHASRGFTEVARLGGPGTEVSLQVKQLA